MELPDGGADTEAEQEYLDAIYTEAEIDFAFKAYVTYLTNLYYHGRAGRNLNNLGLSLYDWNALSIITEHMNFRQWEAEQKAIWGSK